MSFVFFFHSDVFLMPCHLSLSFMPSCLILRDDRKQGPAHRKEFRLPSSTTVHAGHIHRGCHLRGPRLLASIQEHRQHCVASLQRHFPPNTVIPLSPCRFGLDQKTKCPHFLPGPTYKSLFPLSGICPKYPGLAGKGRQPPSLGYEIQHKAVENADSDVRKHRMRALGLPFD